MEKHFQRQDSDLQFNRNIPGCFWSILHTLDYHPWHNVKKMLPYRKHSRSKGGPKTTLDNHHTTKVPEHSSDENKPLLCSKGGSHVDKRSGEAHINVLITKKMSEDEGQKYWKLNFKPKRRLLRTYSIHHLDPSYYIPGNNSEVGDSAVTSPKDNVNHSVTRECTSLQKTPKKLVASEKMCNWLDTMNTEDYFGHRKIAFQSRSFSEKINGVKETLETNKISRDISGHSFKEDVDILEIFKANKKIFAELLQGADGNHYFQDMQKSKTTGGLAKSRSFPSAGFARNRNRKLRSLQHKQIEFFPKGKKSVSDPQPSKLVESESPKNPPEKMTPYEPASTSCHNMGGQTSSSLGPNHGLKHGGWNQLVIKRFNFIKQKIKHAFRERKKHNNQKSAKEISSTVPSEHKLSPDRKETVERLGITTSEDGMGIRGYKETDSSDYEKISGVQTMRRIASLNASLERYAQLFEYGSNRNRAAKCHHSQSLKVANGDRILKSENARKSFKRNLSMPDLDLFCSLFSDPREVFHAAEPIKGLVDPNTDNNIHTDPNSVHASIDGSEPRDSESQNMIENGDQNVSIENSDCSNMDENGNGTAWPDELKGNIPELDISESKNHQVLGSECRFYDVGMLSQHGRILDLEICLQDDATCFLELSNSKELNPECRFGIELEPSGDLTIKSTTESLPSFETMVNHNIVDDIEKLCNNLYLHSEFDSIHNADFNYMRYILQVSSFIESDPSIGHSFNPSLFDGLENHFYRKLECYWKKVDKNSNHQLLLDLVYETLHNVFERSFIYYLKDYSLKCQIRPMPLGQYLLEEVREKVAWYLCLGPELDQSLDDVVGRDFKKGDDWMNLQSEKECLALEMEDLILDELLDEVICC